MLVVKLEVWPLGDRRAAREIGSIQIGNVDADADAAPPPVLVGGFWRYAIVVDGRIFTFDFDDSIASSDRAASVATIAISTAADASAGG